MNRRDARQGRTLLLRWAIGLVAFVSLVVGAPQTASATNRPGSPSSS